MTVVCRQERSDGVLQCFHFVKTCKKEKECIDRDLHCNGQVVTTSGETAYGEGRFKAPASLTNFDWLNASLQHDIICQLSALMPIQPEYTSAHIWNWLQAFSTSAACSLICSDAHVSSIAPQRLPSALRSKEHILMVVQDTAPDRWSLIHYQPEFDFVELYQPSWDPLARSKILQMALKFIQGPQDAFAALKIEVSDVGSTQM